MKKKLIAALLCLNMIWMSVLSASAYLAGEPQHSLTAADCISGSYSGSKLVLAAGDVATYDFFMPFDAVKVDITYEKVSKDVTLTLSGDYVTQLNALADTATLSHFFVGAERIGTKTMTLSADSAITITDITFTKEDINEPTAPINNTEIPIERPLPDMTENERAIESAVLMDTQSNVIMVRGAKRYVDNANLALKLPNIEGCTYLPAKTLAYAFSIYHEDLPDKNYLLLRKGEKEYIYKDGVSKIRTNSGAWQDIDLAVLYQNGAAYLPVRQTAEIFGYAVDFKDGIIAIDTDKFTIGKIFNTQAVFSYVNDCFAPFRAEWTTGKTYHVAQNNRWSSDNNNGSIQTPFKTISKAAQVAQAGDTVIVHAGTYREILAPQNSGTANAPITFCAAEGEEVIISANDALTQVAEYKDGLLTFALENPLEEGRNQIFYQGKALAEGRYPNGESIIPATNRGEFGDLFPTIGDLSVENMEQNYAKSTKVVSDTLLQDESINWAGGTYISLHGYAWTLGSAKIGGSGKGYLDLSEYSTNWWWSTGPLHQLSGVNYGYITNHEATIDLPGEWVVKDNQLIIKPPQGETKDTLKLEAKARQIVADLSDDSFIHLRGFKTIGGGIKMNESQMCMLDGLDMSYISHFTYFDDARNGYLSKDSNHYTQSNPQNGEMGIYLGGSDNAVINSRIDYSAGAGIYGTGTYAYIENNILSNCGYMCMYVSGISFFTENWKTPTTKRGGFALLNNTIYNCGRSTINVSVNDQWITDMVTFDTPTLAAYIPFEIAYNKCYNGILTGRDGGLMYNYAIGAGREKVRSLQHHNMVYTDVPETRHLSAGIYHDGWSQGVDVYNNIIFLTQPDVVYSLGDIYIQHELKREATCREWNNKELGYVKGGEAALTAQDYPEARPFFTGAHLDAEQYLTNYNTAYTETAYKSAVDAEYSAGVKTDRGVVEFTENGQWVKFENVNFGVGNVLEVYFKGDRYNTGDVIDVVVGDDLETGTAYPQTLTATAVNRWDNNLAKLKWANAELGTTTIWLRAKDLKSAAIDKITISRDINENLATQVFGGDDGLEVISGRPTAKIAVPGDNVNKIINQTNPGMVVKYAAKVVPYTVDTMEICATSSQDSAGNIYWGQRFTIRTGSRNGPVIAEWEVPNSGWDNYVPEDVKLTKPLEAGTYDFYLVAEPNSEIENYGIKTSNFYYFGFKDSQRAAAASEAAE